MNIKHVALIMDGNGRWAKQRGLSRIEGHRKGVKRVNEMIDAAIEITVDMDANLKYNKVAREKFWLCT